MVFAHEKFIFMQCNKVPEIKSRQIDDVNSAIILKVINFITLEKFMM